MPETNLFRSFRAVLFALLLAAHALTQTVVSYHGVSSATHQTQFTTLSGQGYRIVSLSVAGNLSAPLYSAVWEQTGGPSWQASHDMSGTQYATFRTNCIAQGYRAKLITAAGTTSANRVFAAVFVADGATVVDSTGYFESTFVDTCNTQRTAGRIPVSVDSYGDTGYGPYVCAVFEPNTGNKVWGCHVDANSTEFAETRAAHGDGDARLACLGMSDTQRYVSVWYDDRVGTETMSWNATGTGWQTFYNAQSGYQRTIASGGSGAGLRFAGSFAQYRFPLIRTNTTTGVYRSQFAAMDTHMQSVLVDSGARAAALAIAKDGKLVYARGFTRAEGTYPVTQPDDVFRIASLTKVMNAVATHQADEMGLLTMTEKPHTVLGMGFVSAGFPNIEIRHILDYTSGIQTSYSAAGIAAAMSVPLPISVTTGASWLSGQALVFQPPSVLGPTYYMYSNAAWMLTAECIRVRSGLPFTTFLDNHVFGPLSITGVKVAASSRLQMGPNDVFPHLTWLRTVPTELNNTGTRVSEQFHEDLNFKRTSGGLACSAIDYVRFLSGVFDLQGADAIVLTDATRAYALQQHTYDDYESTGTKDICRAGMSWHSRANGVVAYTKGGSLESASTNAGWRTDGWSFAVFANIGDASLGGETIQTFLDGLTSWPNVDEFPSYGMPSFAQRPRLESIAPASLPNVTTSRFTITGKRMDTVTRVDFGNLAITSQSPGNWADGYFEVVSPTELRLYPPQGRVPGTYTVRLVNAVGNSVGSDVDLTFATTFRIGAPGTVGNQPWACVVARGTQSGLPLATSFTILCASFSNVPSSAPGLVNLGLGNQFGELLTTGAFQFGLLNSTVRFDLPVLPTGTIYLEAVGFDVAQPSIFPLSTTTTLAVTRQ
ncbi:MAG: serine hydrolase [Planctomycetes bacterium]|nr:serine hydrolase [Planctomycetota bacterium]